MNMKVLENCVYIQNLKQMKADLEKNKTKQKTNEQPTNISTTEFQFSLLKVATTETPLMTRDITGYISAVAEN